MQKNHKLLSMCYFTKDDDDFFPQVKYNEDKIHQN